MFGFYFFTVYSWPPFRRDLKSLPEQRVADKATARLVDNAQSTGANQFRALAADYSRRNRQAPCLRRQGAFFYCPLSAAFVPFPAHIVTLNRPLMSLFAQFAHFW